MTRKEIEEEVFELVGEASMCWDSTGSAIFDTERAHKVGDAHVAYIQKLLQDQLTEVEKVVERDMESIQRTQLGLKPFNEGCVAALKEVLSHLKAMKELSS